MPRREYQYGHQPLDPGTGGCSAVATGALGIPFTIMGISGLVTGRMVWESRRASDIELTGNDARVQGAILLLLGLLCLAAPALLLYMKFVEEGLHRRRMSADEGVAHGLVLAGTIIGGGMMLGAGVLGFLVIVLGLVVGIVVILIGLVLAFGPNLAFLKRAHPHARVDGRFGYHGDLGQSDNHPEPHIDGLIPYLRLRLACGKIIEVRCSPATYELNPPGTIGSAYVKGNRLVRFVRSGRSRV